MTTGRSEAHASAGKLDNDVDTPTRDQTAIDAGYASDAFASGPSGIECLTARLPEWPETAVDIYI